MGQRAKPRIKMVAPVRVWGTDSTGTPFNALAHTLNVSSTGARIGGLKVPLGVGDAITIQYKQQRALFKVVWLGRPGDSTRDQIGAALLEQDRQIWAEITEPANYKDDFSGRRSERPAAAPAPPAPPVPQPEAVAAAAEAAAETAEARADGASGAIANLAADEGFADINAMMTACAKGLLRIEQAVQQSPPDAGPLQEFRNALAKLRHTVWALQQWHELKTEGKKPFPLLSYLNSERLRFVVQAARDLADDMAHKGVEVDPSLLQSFLESADRLRDSAPRPGFRLEVVPPDARGPIESTDDSHIVTALRTSLADVQRAGMTEGAAADFLSRELQRTFSASGIAIAKLEEGEMVCAGSSGNAPEAGMLLEIESGIGAQAMESRELVYCPDTQSDPRVDAELCRAANIGAVVMVPLLSDGREPVGLIQVSSARPNPFGNHHLAALRRAAELLRGPLMGKGAASKA